MGAGKTSIGKKLAKKLACPFMDTDKLIAIEEGMSISKIFELKGEAYFRSLEKKLIEGLITDEFKIVATGGGLPCHNDLMSTLNILGTCVYLKVKPETLFLRLKEGKFKRPLIANFEDEALRIFIEEKLLEREKTYLKAAIVLVEAEQKIENVILHLHQCQKSS